jgi:hypothetical protein
MAYTYVGPAPVFSDLKKIDNIASSFNGVTTTFNLTSNSVPLPAGFDQNLIISINGVIQEPGAAFTTSGTTITFTDPPQAGWTFFGVAVGGLTQFVIPADGSVSAAKLSSNSVTVSKLVTGQTSNANVVFYPTLISSNAGDQTIRTSPAVQFNPQTNTLTVSNIFISGSISGAGTQSMATIGRAYFMIG